MDLRRQIGVRFTPAQHEALQRIARERGIGSVSTLVRSVVVQALFLPTDNDKHVTTPIK